MGDPDKDETTAKDEAKDDAQESGAAATEGGASAAAPDAKAEKEPADEPAAADAKRASDDDDADDDDADEPSTDAAASGTSEAPKDKPAEAPEKKAADAAKKAAAPAGPNPIVQFFWMADQVKAAREQGFDKDKPGWAYYELAREAVIAAQRLGELSEAKLGVLLLNREAAVLLAQAELQRAGATGGGFREFAALESAKPFVEKLSEDERGLVAQVLAADGLEALAALPPDRRTTVGKALATLASKVYEQLEREANRVASVLYLRWAKILGAVGLVLLLVGGVYYGIKSTQAGPNVALGAKVRLSSNSRKYGVAPERAVDGNRGELGFHTNKEKDPWVQLDLGAEKRIRQVVVVNRDTFPERAVPLIVEVSKDGRDFEEVAKREEPFNVWTASFGGKTVRFVRLKALKNTFLHLNEIELH